MKFKSNKGFTLIELLVVISIIGLLSSIVLASLNTARAKGRDAKRMSDIREIRNALELYRTTTGYYPVKLSELTTPVPYIKSISQDPLGSAGGTWQKCRPDYCYTTNALSNPSSYHIGALMENLGSVLSSDSDTNDPGTYFLSSASWNVQYDFDGSASYIYDLKN